jgi:hypothetical protein
MASERTQLEELIVAWPKVPPHIRAAIHDIVLANTIRMNASALWPSRACRLHSYDRDYEEVHRTGDDMKLKQCTKCKQWKDKNAFYRNRRSNDGLKSQCKTCSSRYAKKRTVRSNSGL